ncbi:hypothetical protein C9925_00500 [cyanobacterium G8-9]|nr:hypothetical protein C9925_00500 [cyanobacterium G8-9]
MAQEEDEKALQLLEKAVYKAQDSLATTKHFQPFLMIRTDVGNIEVYENQIENTSESYADLEVTLTKRLSKGDVDIMVLVVDTVIPDKFVEDISSGIRVHLEEKSQKDKKIGARFLYVPYELCRVGDGELFVKLHMPIPVGFPAEYIV